MLKVFDRAEEIKSSVQEVIDLLEGTLERVKNGDLAGSNKCVVVLVDDDLDTFLIRHLYAGRATSILGYLELAKLEIVRDTGTL